MRIQITGRNMSISDAIERYVNKKVGKLDRIFSDEFEAQVRLSVEHYRCICEVTIPLHGVTLRAEESSPDMYTSIDNVLSKLEGQIRKYRTKLDKRMRADSDKLEEISAPFGEVVTGQLVRTKRFRLTPMDVDEAIEQMDMLGHSFFLFMDRATGQTCVVYAREDGNYGLLIPEE